MMFGIAISVPDAAAPCFFFCQPVGNVKFRLSLSHRVPLVCGPATSSFEHHPPAPSGTLGHAAWHGGPYDPDQMGEAKIVATLSNPIQHECHLPSSRVEAVAPALLKPAFLRALLREWLQPQQKHGEAVRLQVHLLL